MILRASRLGVVSLVLTCWWGNPVTADDLIVVVGAGGTPEYESRFDLWADRWMTLAEQTRVPSTRIDASTSTPVRSSRDQIRDALAGFAADVAQAGSDDENADDGGTLWLILIGHGTFFADQAKFNLTGPDITARELAEWLRPIERPVAVLNCASASGPFINRLSADGRVILTATQSGTEDNATRLGDYLSRAFTQPGTDVDHDDEVSLLEAFRRAAADVAAAYKAEDRLVTEHALIDDNGDALGTPAKALERLSIVSGQSPDQIKPDGEKIDGVKLDGDKLDGDRARRWTWPGLGTGSALTAEQKKQRDALETRLADLRSRKSELVTADYDAKLESILIPLAKIYASLDSTDSDSPAK